MIATTGGEAVALAAKATTETIPIVFGVAQDPVPFGLVASHSRPGGNATGVNFLIAELGSKQLGLLHELVPAAARVGLLVNPNFAATERAVRDVTAAASAIGLQIDVLQASDSREIESVFGTLVHNKADALLVGPDAFLVSRRLQLAILAARHALPAVYNVREYPEAGGLMSYGTNVRDAYRQIGVYAGRILKGAKPADLPVVQRGNAYEKCPSNGHFFRRVQKMRDIAGWIAAGCANGPASVTQSLSAPPYSSSSPHATNVRINSATVVPRRLAMAFSI